LIFAYNYQIVLLRKYKTICLNPSEIFCPPLPQNVLDPKKASFIEKMRNQSIAKIINRNIFRWSFGVVLWEIITLGAFPYASMTDHQLVERVANGLKLHQPSNCSQKMFQFMALKLWNFDCETRPTFQEIQRHLHDFNCHPEVREIISDFSQLVKLFIF